jgi:hypothetical protein
VVECTAEIQQIEEAFYAPHDAELLTQFPDAALPLGHGGYRRVTGDRRTSLMMRNHLPLAKDRVLYDIDSPQH